MQAIVLAAGREVHETVEGRKTDLQLVDVQDGTTYTVTLVRRLQSVPNIESVHVVARDSVAQQLRRDTADEPKKPFIVNVDEQDPDEVRPDAIGHLLLTIDRQNIDDDVAVVGGENWFTYDLGDFIGKACQYPAALVVTEIEPGVRPARFGWVRVDSSSRVTEFLEHPSSLESDGFLKASCVYYFSREQIALLPLFSQQRVERATPGDFVSWLVDRGADVHAIAATAYSPHGLMRGPDFLAWRDLLRIAANPIYSSWEKEAAQKLSNVSSHTELIDALRDDSVNTRIVSADLLGRSESLLDDVALATVKQRLLEALSDGAENEIGYGGSEDDECSAFFVSATAAASLVNLGYASDVAEVFEKARQEGHTVVERRNRP